MKNEEIFEKLEKYRKKSRNITKIVDEVLKKHDFSDDSGDVKNQLCDFAANFDFHEENIEEFRKSSKDTEKTFEPHDFFTFVIERQFTFLKKIIETQNYYKKLEEDNTSLKQDNIRLESQLREYIDLSSRLKKDYENLSRRTEKEKEVLEQNASRKICSSIIEIMDNFILAVNSFRKSEGDRLEKDKVLEGLEKIEKKITGILVKEGVTEIESLNTRFDHNFHEAIATEERDDISEDDIVTEEFRKGYMFKEDVLRPSLVKVAKKIDAAEVKNGK